MLEKNREISRRQAVHVAYDRDPKIAEYAKRRADGVCQLCKKEAPFLNQKGKPYLECHHIEWITNGGSDSIDNLVALCPNCHKKMHVLNKKKDKLTLEECTSQKLVRDNSDC